jgi:hypothetical protein
MICRCICQPCDIFEQASLVFFFLFLVARQRYLYVMPLHLLGKKSWNVYNPANIERVKRDEAEARRKAIEEEKRSLQDDASNRLELLKQQSVTGSSERKSLKRKFPGEDETDREIRLAGQRDLPPSSKRGRSDDGSIVDSNGHIALVRAASNLPQTARKPEKDEHTVYLTDVTGERGRDEKAAWYTSLEEPKESWGDDNPRRKEREVARMSANDPLAAMKRGVKTLRENEKARQEWKAQRERDLVEVEELARKQRVEEKRRRRRHRNENEVESLDNFDLDAGYKDKAQDRKTRSAHSHDKRHKHRHRDGESRSHRHRHREEG